VKKLFEKVESDTNGQLDILVNNAFAGAPSIVQYGGLKFYEAPPEMWDEINEVGLRNHYFCSVLAARMMVKRKRGLIVNISSAGGLQYVFNVPYGVGKAAMDRMAADMALELKNDGVSVVSLWPGVVQTELGMSSLKKGVLVKALNMPQDLLEESMTHGETPEFVGKAVAALAKDRNRIKKSGRILLTTDLAREYRFRDVKDVMPPNLRSVRAALQFFGWPRLAQFVPSFIRIPTVFLHFASYKF
jgi:dehydrogenase/reductase SDR family protein 1